MFLVVVVVDGAASEGRSKERVARGRRRRRPSKRERRAIGGFASRSESEVGGLKPAATRARSACLAARRARAVTTAPPGRLFSRRPPAVGIRLPFGVIGVRLRRTSVEVESVGRTASKGCFAERGGVRTK